VISASRTRHCASERVALTRSVERAKGITILGDELALALHLWLADSFDLRSIARGALRPAEHPRPTGPI
jgi:hypothetical protein